MGCFHYPSLSNPSQPIPKPGTKIKAQEGIKEEEKTGRTEAVKRKKKKRDRPSTPSALKMKNKIK